MISIPKDRILILDGAMGTMIQRYSLTEEDYRCARFESCTKELYGNNECLNITRPDIIKAIHKEYIEAGTDIIETNTFSANHISQSEYGCEGWAAKMAFEGARIAREAADEAAVLGRKVWVAGSIGPTSKSLSLSPDVSDPTFRPYPFSSMKEAYSEQVTALLDAGADILLIETCFDALNAKAVLAAINDYAQAKGICPPVMISVSVGDKSGRTLTGQTLEAFYTSVLHYPILSFGLNCSLGAAEMTPLMEDIASWCTCGISCYPNAGLPNEIGEYDQSPEEMGRQMREIASKGLINIAGGCCGTTPAHIRAIADALRTIAPHQLSGNRHEYPARALKVSGLECVTVDVKRNNFTNVGERTNVAGSRKFARLIAEGNYDEALQIAAKQISDGAAIIDINMDDAMLDSTREMERFVRYISNDPAVAKAALMIDSSHWDTIIAGLENAQGKCIVNSISLKEGPEKFIEKARIIKSFGAAMVVMAFDETGQATTFDRKTEICGRAYRLLTQEAGIAPEDIIFDVNILSIGTGIAEHALYAVDFIEAVRWIKTNLPGALTSGGVSNLSFSFRGNNAVREAMHSAFLYHAIKAGLDMAIVNPSMLQVYDEIEPELLKCVEDVIFNTGPQATERLIEKAAAMLDAKKESDRTDLPGGAAKHETETTDVATRLKNTLIKGQSKDLATDIEEALRESGSAVAIIEGPLMDGMETVGKLFGEGKMFLPQVVKSAKIMRDAVEILQPYITAEDTADSGNKGRKPVIVIATVKGDVHDIGKNITGIVLTCNGFSIHDLGVMVDKETILAEAERLQADIIAVSGLITPSLYHMEEICREMSARKMSTPLFIGGATTSALHTAVKLAPHYDHVYHGPDASAAAIMAKRYMMDPETFEETERAKQKELRALHNNAGTTGGPVSGTTEKSTSGAGSPSDTGCTDSYIFECPADIPAQEIPAEEVLPYFDWRMFYAIWGVRYGSASPEAMELIQLRRDAEEELSLCNFRIKLVTRFYQAHTDGKDIVLKLPDRKAHLLPMMRQEKNGCRSLCDFVAPEESGKTSPVGCFAISVSAADAHEEGCCCPACSNKYEDLIAKTVRMTIAEAASAWLDAKIRNDLTSASGNIKVIKPAAGYSSCPDHTLKRDILDILGSHDSCTCESHHEHHEGCNCGEYDKEHTIGIKLTESCAMIPEASICGLIFLHKEASYPEIRSISLEQYEDYVGRRGMSQETARRFLSHLLK